MRSFTIEPRGPFSLAAAGRFASGFGPLAPATTWDGSALRAAFPVDGLEGAAGVSVREDGGLVVARVAGAGADLAVVRRQLERMLSLHRDASGLADVGARDPVAGEALRALPGLRPVLFPSPYEAAAWAVLSVRLHRRQALALHGRLREALGDEIDVDGVSLRAFPLPQRLLELRELPGAGGERLARLHGVAEAALDGTLDPDRLDRLDPEAAADEVRRVRGLGPFSAGLVVARALGPVDHVFDAGLAVRAEGWRPYRGWIAFLLRVLAEPIEIIGASGRDRAAAAAG